jgi:orotate phosphoribosyltransferase
MEQLIVELRKLNLVVEGDFVLTSRKKTNYYVDIKKAFGHPRVFGMICEELSKIIDRNATCVAGSGHGGIPLVSVIALKLGLHAVFVKDVAKKHGRRNIIDGYVPTDKDRVVIVDDVLTTGGSLTRISDSLGVTGAKILNFYVVIDRSDRSDIFKPLRSLVRVEDLY